MQQFKVRHLQDDTYQVISLPEDYEQDDLYDLSVLYQGSLADCEAYIRLTENGYM